jgi:hypothetical protein
VQPVSCRRKITAFCSALKVPRVRFFFAIGTCVRALKYIEPGDVPFPQNHTSGRIVPFSAHPRKEMLTWNRKADPEGWVVPTTRNDGPRRRVARQRDMQRSWIRSGVREAVWRGNAMRSFRKGFQSELKRLGADDEAVKYLVGHDLGVRGHYIDPHALRLRETIDVIPAVDLLSNVTHIDNANS